MSGTIPKKNKLFDKLTKNIHLDRLTRTPSPVDVSAFPQLLSLPSSKKDKVKPHNSNVILIPTDEEELDDHDKSNTSKDSNHSRNSGKEMLSNAFEVTMDQNGDSRNLHPLDQPITLGNGRKVYPISPTSENSSSIVSKSHNSGKNSDVNLLSSEELIKIFISMFQITSSIIIQFWNMDLNFNISISEDSTMKVHIPTVILSIISLKLMFSLFSSNDNDQFTAIKRSNSNNNGSLSMFTILLIGCLITYCYLGPSNSENKYNNSKNSLLSSKISFSLDDYNNASIDSIFETHTKAKTKTNIKSHTKNIIGNTYNTESAQTFDSFKLSDSYTDITPPISRNNSIGKNIEAKIMESKPVIDRSHSPIRRDRLQKEKHRHLHLPLEQKKKSDNITNTNTTGNKNAAVSSNNHHVDDIDYMTKIGRAKMLNAFN